MPPCPPPNTVFVNILSGTVLASTLLGTFQDILSKAKGKHNNACLRTGPDKFTKRVIYNIEFFYLLLTKKVLYATVYQKKESIDGPHIRRHNKDSGEYAACAY
jgi:hypothetical protein